MIDNTQPTPLDAPPSSEIQRLRAIMPKILEALESGACSPDCSLEFFELIPNEIRLVGDRRKRDANRMIKSFAELREQVRLTIMENLHLADGEICTLKRLKDAIEFELPPEL